MRKVLSVPNEKVFCTIRGKNKQKGGGRGNVILETYKRNEFLCRIDY